MAHGVSSRRKGSPGSKSQCAPHFPVLHKIDYRTLACSRKVDLSHLSKVRMSPCPSGRGVARHGMGRKARRSPCRRRLGPNPACRRKSLTAGPVRPAMSDVSDLPGPASASQATLQTTFQLVDNVRDNGTARKFRPLPHLSCPKRRARRPASPDPARATGWQRFPGSWPGAHPTISGPATLQ